MITILGIDPGLQATGWGAIRVNGSALSFVGSGTITSDTRAPLAVRLAALYAGLQQVVAEIAPEEAAVETTFVSRDGAATLKLGQARGIALLAPAAQGIPVSEYAPNLVKKSVVGAGHADKRQIRHMIGVLLPRATAKSDHAADALAVAICHASHRTARAWAAA
ncbi:crossover junction endodeoxyribonuclease RuvC [Acuticoccus sediminis]|uniref:Crossover junction endodeoxyribonuclease RuvC n=1 Tax=Acuticoccus sediminis TaxID=2184697 RepID=A0A8B2NXY5_9HYPH|nr:crossover junction endodeoxyribonuclease RuvC [Acuticoccus sediminis]RAI03701.1 crossover junction endodeoxyribonuclease RuvC [Acuticoccus sediminis]